MNVAGLQQHLGDLARLLDGAGAKNVAGDLNTIQIGLAPFGNLNLKEFADFLSRADTFARDGSVPLKPAPGRKPTGSTPGSNTRGRADPASLARETKTLYDRASDPSVTENDIAALMSKLNGLSKDGLLTVAETIELMGMRPKTKPVIIDAIRRRIEERRGSKIRSELIHRDSPDANEAENGQLPKPTASDVPR